MFYEIWGKQLQQLGLGLYFLGLICFDFIDVTDVPASSLSVRSTDLTQAAHAGWDKAIYVWNKNKFSIKKINLAPIVVIVCLKFRKTLILAFEVVMQPLIFRLCCTNFPYFRVLLYNSLGLENIGHISTTI